MYLEAVQIGFRYRSGPWIIRNGNLTVARGDIVGLAGPSGIGKTTFARILAGYELPQEGTVMLGGAPLPERGYHPVQLVSQHPEKAVNPRWRMRDVLEEAWTPDASFLSRLGIRPEWMNRRPNELSGGELQRFCVARALGPKTRFLIADEMTAMLDAITQAQIWQAVLRHANEREIGILVISHELHLLRAVCGSVAEFSRITS